jgi:PAS domain S-box-containing protein
MDGRAGTRHDAAVTNASQSVLRDESDPRQRLLAERLVQEVLLAEAVTNAGFVVLVADERMRYLAVSDGACEVLGYSRDELLRLSVPDVVVETEAGALYDQFLRAGSQQGRITLRCKDGSHVTAGYAARKTRVSGLPGYVSILSPLEPGGA